MRQPRRSWLIGAMLVLSVLCASAGAQTFDTYYTCLPGSATAVVLTNASAYAADEAFTLTVHSAHGDVLACISDSLSPYESKVVFLDEHMDTADEYSWGLLHIDASILLQVGLWIGVSDSWISITNLRTPTLSTEGLNILNFWYGANYANTENRRTGIGLINPNAVSTTGTVYVYDSSGGLQNYSDFSLEPYSSAYFKPETVFPIGDEMWGLVDVRASTELIVIGEYYDASGTMVDVDVIDAVYYLQAENTVRGDP